MKIVQLQAENVKRLVAVELSPEGNMIVIGGKNGAGKSSVLDSIVYALCGKRSIPPKPLREGTKEGRVVIRLEGDENRSLAPLCVTRTFTEDGTTSLEVVTDDEYRALAPSPQSILDQLVGRLGFDPLEFCRLKPKEQVDRLKEIVGLDFTDIDKEYSKAYTERTAINKEGVQLKAQLDAAPPIPPDTPAEEISIKDLNVELTQAVERDKQKATLSAQIQQTTETIATARTRIDALTLKAAEIEKELSRSTEEIGTLEAEYGKMLVAIGEMPDSRVPDIQRQMAEASTTNATVRERSDRIKLNEKLNTLRERSRALTTSLHSIEQDKRERMAEASWPMEGVGFSEEGVMLNGFPFEQASQAEQLKVSVALGAAANPRLRVLMVRDGSLLDKEMLSAIATIAKERDLQLFVERVSEDGQGCSVLIEVGSVRKTPELE